MCLNGMLYGYHWCWLGRPINSITISLIWTSHHISEKYITAIQSINSIYDLLSESVQLCTNGVDFNPSEGRTNKLAENIIPPKNLYSIPGTIQILVPTLLGWLFRLYIKQYLIQPGILSILNYTLCHVYITNIYLVQSGILWNPVGE